MYVASAIAFVPLVPQWVLGGSFLDLEGKGLRVLVHPEGIR